MHGPTYVTGNVPVTSTAGVASLDLSKGNVFTFPLTENVTSLRASNCAGKVGQTVTVIFTQDAAPRTVTPDGTTIKNQGGSGNIPQGLVAGATTVVLMTVDGDGVLQCAGTIKGLDA